jgi:uncharacterized membrane protein YfcA
LSNAGVLLILLFGALGAFVQAVTGFGGSLVLAPVLFATMRPAQAVLLSALLGLVQSGVMVVRNRHEVLWHELRALLTFAVPGLAAGVLVLRFASPSALRVAVGVSVIVATVARRMLAPAARIPRGAAGPAGFLAGLLTTSVTVNGPPLVLYLSGRGTNAAQMRGTSSAVFFGLDTVTVLALGVGGTLVLAPIGALVTVVLAFPLGLVAGLWLGPQMPEHMYARAVTVVLLALGGASVVAGLG